MEFHFLYHNLIRNALHGLRGKSKYYIDEKMARLEPDIMRMRGLKFRGADGHFHCILHLRLTTCVAYKSVGPRAAAPVLTAGAVGAFRCWCSSGHKSLLTPELPVPTAL